MFTSRFAFSARIRVAYAEVAGIRRVSRTQWIHQSTLKQRPTTQCAAKSRLEAIRRFPISIQIRQMRYQAQTKKGWISRAWKGYKILYRENPVSMSVVTFM